MTTSRTESPNIERRIFDFMLANRLLLSVGELETFKIDELDAALPGWRDDRVTLDEVGEALLSDDPDVDDALQIWWKKAKPATTESLDEFRTKFRTEPTA